MVGQRGCQRNEPVIASCTGLLVRPMTAQTLDIWLARTTKFSVLLRSTKGNLPRSQPSPRGKLQDKPATTILPSD
jgi:hypothetical protein